MKKGLQWKLILTLVVLAGCIFVAYPIQKKIKLGLDLKGGIHLVLQVITEDAVNVETDQEIVRLQDLFKKNSITFTTIAKERPGRFAVQGINPDQEGKTRELFDQYLRDWDYSFVGSSATVLFEGARSPIPQRPGRQSGR